MDYRTVIICPYLVKANPGSNYLTCDKFVCVCVSLLLLVLQSAAFYAGSGKSNLENAASRIPTVKISQRPSVTRVQHR
jgi:hypothetical protein